VTNEVRQDAGVGIGGQHDARVAEHGLDYLQVRSGGQGQRGLSGHYERVAVSGVAGQHPGPVAENAWSVTPMLRPN